MTSPQETGQKWIRVFPKKTYYYVGGKKRKKRYTDQQIAFALKQAECGISVDEIIRKMGISEATFYNWKKKYSGLEISELKRL